MAHQPVASRRRSRIGSALLAAHSPQAGTLSSAIVSAAQHSFVSGFHVAVVIAATIVLFGAVGVLIWLPAREAASEPVPAEVQEYAVAAAAPGAPALEPAFEA